LDKAGAEVAVCKVCRGLSRFILALDNLQPPPDKLKIYLCSNCGLLFVGDEISESQLLRAYIEADYSSLYSETEPTARKKASSCAEDLAALLRGENAGHKLLDVGCGTGIFLDAITMRFPQTEVAGFELSEEAARACRLKGFRVFSGRSLAEVPARFSVITLLDVAEHVLRPDLLFGEIHALLNPGGFLYLHTPGRCFFDTAALRTSKGLFFGVARLWLSTRVSSGHLQLWTERSLRLALETAGFTVLRMRRQLELSWPVERYARIYLGGRLGLPTLLVRAAAVFFDVLLVRWGLLKNKLICVAQKPAAL